MSELLDSSTTVAGLGRLNDPENLSLNDHDDVVFLARFPAGNVFYQLSQGNLIRLAGDGDAAPVFQPDLAQLFANTLPVEPPDRSLHDPADFLIHGVYKQ